MRAGPLSNDTVIRMLNERFVPVYIANEDYRGEGPAPPDERAERDRIYREARAAGLSAGTVHAYVLAPDGRVIDSLHVAEAAKVERTLAMLERAAARFPPPDSRPLAAAGPPPARPTAGEGDLVLHLLARYLRRENGQLVTLTQQAGLGQTRNASWQAYPAENWIVFASDEVAGWLPSGPVEVGDRWTPAPGVVRRLLVFCYPSTECNDPDRNQIQRQQLTATVTAVRDGIVCARLEGSLRMKHPFYPGREDQNTVEASLLGYIEFQPAAGRIRTLRLITDQATYGRWPFAVAVQSTVD